MTSGKATMETPLLEVDGVMVSYRLPSQRMFRLARAFRAVDGVSLTVARGESLGLVGETGCGKSSLARAIYGLAPISGGAVRFEGMDLATASGAGRRAIRRGMQMIFQDPGGSLNPRMRVGALVAEPLEIHGEGNRRSRRDRVAEVLEAMGLAAGDAARLPHELSGGQRQRVAIARAIVLEPALVLADEPTSALDVSLQAQILNLIAGLRRDMGLALLFVSHDLDVVGHLCDRIAVMYLGRIVESGPAAEVLASPGHPYTRALVASSPVPDPDRPIRSAAAVGGPPESRGAPRGLPVPSEVRACHRRLRLGEPGVYAHRRRPTRGLPSRGAADGHEVRAAVIGERTRAPQFSTKAMDSRLRGNDGSCRNHGRVDGIVPANAGTTLQTLLPSFPRRRESMRP